jgi:hypothetical protein
MDKLYSHFEKISQLKAGHYRLSETKFQWDEQDHSGMGQVDGVMFYETENENGDVSSWGGPFTIYMANHYDIWKITSFELPGFSWKE